MSEEWWREISKGSFHVCGHDDVTVLRDRFAMAALSGLLAASLDIPDCIKDSDLERSTAEIAYWFADAMLEARKEK